MSVRSKQRFYQAKPTEVDMRLSITIVIAGALLFPLTAFATIINIPDDYDTIQEGIDASSDGDTVLVQPDIYVENINFNGHNIVVGSLFLTTGDTSYISSTIVDGDSSMSVVRFQNGEDSTAVITGFTLQNGFALRGGGIYCYDSNPTIRSNIITRNLASGKPRYVACGGAMYCEYADPLIAGNTIAGNSAVSESTAAHGGGIYCSYSNPTIRRNIIIENEALSIESEDHGGAIFCSNCPSPLISENTICGNSAVYGTIYCYHSNPTIVSNSIAENSVGYGGGAYFRQCANPVVAGNIITGNSASGGHGGAISCWLAHPTITRNIITGNSAHDWGGGIYCWGSNSTITNNIISENSGNYGGGIHFKEVSSLMLLNNVISNNYAGYRGGGIICRANSTTTIANNIFFGNSARNGAGAFYCWDSDPIIKNTIFWENSAPEGPEILVYSGSPVITYCDIEDTLWPGEGNISLAPLFRDPENGDFHLQSITNPDCGGPGDSPCIDAGDSSFVDSLISCDWGLGTLRSDMGAYGGGDSLQAGIPEQQENIPTCFYLSQNYPNPFNATTVINYRLPTNNSVKLEIYSLLGQKVATLLNGKQQAGYRSVVWDVPDLSSGLYFYKLTAGDFTKTKRMILVK